MGQEETTFSLRELVKSTAMTSGLVDPSAIASKVFEQIPPASVRDALYEALRTYVRVEIANIRLHARQGPPPASNGKAARIRTWYQEWLKQPIHVEGSWKAMGECREADLIAAAAERRQIASRTLSVAEQFEKLALELRRAKVTYVHELPRETVARLTGRAVAA